MFTPVSEYMLVKRARLISLDSGRLLFALKELVGVRSGRANEIALAGIDRGMLQTTLDKMKVIYEESRRQTRRLTDIYDF
jgi:hypothetical protein